MSRTQKVALYMAGAVAALSLGLAVFPYRSFAQTPAPSAPATGKRGVVIDNARVTVQRVSQPAGTIEKPHAHDEDYVSIQLTPGDLEVTIGSETTKGTPGKAWWLPKGTNHTVNNPGTTPVEVMVITVK